ncbi:hypothetical protein HYO14_05215 [Vibrio parahaemolyticus]|nr:hypothetical protein [Vibrio parahaemolyticus]MBM5002117.1 hypothetical protein [Vibrio parahaemolyticus]
MSIKNYWPLEQNVRDCIHSEAEVLSDALLLAVHTPMRLQSISYNDRNNTNPKKDKTENDFLEYVIKNVGPFPVVGESGSGKSHLVRWLHTKLKQLGYDKKWHIVRIPKNATMVQALTLLLDGLEGEDFDKARDQVKTVGTDKSPDLIRELFFTYLVHALKNISVASELSAKDNKNKGNVSLAKEFKKTATIAKNLSVCFSDLVFKGFFTGNENPITNTIERLTKSKSYSEINDAIYTIKVNDIDIINHESFDLDEFSSTASRAFQNLHFYNSDDIENDPNAILSVEIINQAISDTSKLVFQELFKFNSGSFPDLFRLIRRALKKQERTLAILVEDLAAISAIDNVLLDCFTEGGIYDGDSYLCDLKAIIATTSGQDTYLKQQETIHTRAGDEQLEWHISTSQKTNSQYENDNVLVDFCARYINAARLGIEEIKSHYLTGANMVPVWKISEPLSDIDEKTLADFGRSSNGIPLFPLSRTAINNLAKLKVYRGNSHNFNPRVVIKELLLPILRDNFSDFINDDYPSSNFTRKFEFKTPDSIREWSMEHYFSDGTARRRLDNFLTIYASTLGVRQPFSEIQQGITADQANVFHLPSDKLGDKVVNIERCNKCSEKIEQCVCPTEPVENNRVHSESSRSPRCSDCGELKSECTCSETDALETKINNWFTGESLLDAPISLAIRSHLLEVLTNDITLSQYGVNSTNKWGKGNKPLFHEALKNNVRFNIYIPNSVSSIDLKVVSLCRDDQLNDSDAGFKLKKQILAIVRYDYYKKKGDDWNYSKGFEDYAYYMEFMSFWIPSAIHLCLEHIRRETPKLLAKQQSLLAALGISDKKNLVNLLVQRKEHIANKLPKPINNEFRELQEDLLNEWGETREKWLMRLSYSPSSGGGEVALEAPLLQKYLRESKPEEVDTLSTSQRTLYRKAKQDVTSRLIRFTSEVAQFINSEDVRSQFEVLDQIYSTIPAKMMPESTTTRKARNKVAKLKELYEWSLIENSRKFVDTNDDSKQLQALHKIDGEQLNQWLLVLDEFNEIAKYALPKLQKSNEENGGHKMNEYKQNIENYFTVVESAIQALNVSEENSCDL